MKVLALLLGLCSVAWAPAPDRIPQFVEITVTATAYSSAVNQCDSDPYITATGDSVRVGIVALSRDLHRLWGFDKRVYAKIDGDWVELVTLDLMHRRWDRKVDIWMETYADARRFGVRELTVMYEV